MAAEGAGLFSSPAGASGRCRDPVVAADTWLICGSKPKVDAAWRAGGGGDGWAPKLLRDSCGRRGCTREVLAALSKCEPRLDRWPDAVWGEIDDLASEIPCNS